METTIRDFFFQIVLFLAGAVIGITVPLLPRDQQKRAARVLAMLLIGFSVLWAGVELTQQHGPSPEPTITSDKRASDVAPATPPDALPTPTELVPTAIPTQPQSELVESGNNYRIERSCGGQTGAEMQLEYPNGFPVGKLTSWYIYPIVRDIKGHWQRDHPYGGTNLSFSFSSTGKAEENVPSGNWVVEQDTVEDTARPVGYWGNATVGYPSGDLYSFVFPVYDNCITKAVLIFGKLEVGVLNANSTKALPDVYVTLYCQSQDAAGNVIPDAGCRGGEFGIFNHTDATGVATFYLGPGKYYIAVASHDDYIRSLHKSFSGIQMTADEEKRIIVNYP